jgi:hypothetical protein
MQIHVSHQVSQTHDLGHNLYARFEQLAQVSNQRLST